MGFLTGSYFGSFAKIMRLRMDSKLLTIQNQLARVHKQITNQEKMLKSQEQNMNMMLKAQMQRSIWGAAGQIPGFNPSNPMGMMMGTNFNDPAVQQQMQAYQQVQAQMQYQYANAQSVWQNYFDGVRDMTLDALRQQEESLTLEQDHVTRMRDLYNTQEKEVAKQIKQDGAKDFIPSQG